MNHIENLSMKLKPVSPQELTKKSAELTEMQQVYWEFFRRNTTIADTVKSLLEEGRLVNFEQILELTKKLNAWGFIQNPAFNDYFAALKAHAQPAPKPGLFSMFKKEKPDQYLMRHPFFRSQPPAVTALFTQHAEVIDAPAGTALCSSGNLERDIFFLIEGEAAIYKPMPGAGRRLISFLGKDAVIGEVGFFMGELRTADVVVTKDAKLVVVRYNEAAFGRVINKEIAQNLQVRFRVVHALAKSPFMKNIPEDAMQSLIFAGKLREAQEFEVLCKEDEMGDRCFVVISGSVVVSKGTQNINVLEPGEAFGEIALFFTQGRRTATVMAQRHTTVLEIASQDFYRLLGENLLLACEFEKMALERAGKLLQSA